MIANTEFFDFIRARRAHDNEVIFIRASLIESLSKDSSGATRVVMQSDDDGYLVLESMKEILVAIQHSSKRGIVS